MTRHRVALGLLAALACFGAGIAAGQLFVARPPSPSTSSSAALAPSGGPLAADASPNDAGKAPKIFFDPDAIELLPDASLKLTLPPGFDGGAP